MKKQFTPIAMHCNQEQFEAIKPKLKGMQIGCISNFNEWNYLVNNEDGDHFVICNTGKNGSKRYSREIHETWNERIFLEACGIEIEETFEITKETILKYKMKDEFPEVFKVKLEVGKWYKTKSNCLFNLNEITDNFYLGYGFTKSMTYYSYFKEYIRTELKQATEQEVFEALKNEAFKRYKKGDCITGLYRKQEVFLTFDILKNGPEHIYVDEWNSVWMNIGNSLNEKVFDNGTWATIIPTKTKEEAEKLLGVKIID